MAQKLNATNWKLGKFRERANNTNGEKEEVLMEKYMYACKNLCSLLEHQIMEGCHPGQFSLRKARGCIINYTQLPETAVMVPPFRL